MIKKKKWSVMDNNQWLHIWSDWLVKIKQVIKMIRYYILTTI